MDEAEVKTKDCPIYGVSTALVGVIAVLNGKELKVSGMSKCIGSACMMWRAFPDNNGPRQGAGFCGLAGKP